MSPSQRRSSVVRPQGKPVARSAPKRVGEPFVAHQEPRDDLEQAISECRGLRVAELHRSAKMRPTFVIDTSYTAVPG